MKKNLIEVRNYRSGDFEDYFKLHLEINNHDQAVGFISKQNLAETLGHPSFHPDKNLFVAESGGSMIGYASVFLEPGIQRAILECMIHPLHRRNGVATELLREISHHAREAGSVRMQACITQNNLPAKRLASRLGFQFIRYFQELQLDLDAAQLPDPEPGEYSIRSLRANEVEILTQLQNRAFADSWGFNPNTADEIAYRINLSSCSPKNILMAYLKNRPIGYCWTRILVEENPTADRMKGEIHMLGVDPGFRNKGIGRLVLLAGLAELYRRGVTIVGLTADGADAVALGLYKSVGFQVCSRIEWFEKKLA
ncbi:MAG: GNAT family N-acetyltransferase [Desulfobacterales bacterium]|jgi:mycothiol synthase